jgi:MFS transporter, ACS family, tartrate transporter
VADERAVPEFVTADAKSALRKASLRLLPLIGLGYGIAFIDRVNISFAAVQMNHDLGFSAAIYGLGAGLFFLTYTLLEVPSNLLLVRFGAKRWLARIMLTWGLISMAMVLVKTPAQFYVLRLLLGAAEAGFFPGVLYYLSQWYPPNHRSRAISRFYIAAPLASTVMGLVAASLLGLQGKLGLAGWQWLFLLEGAPSVLMSVAFLIFLPDNPAKAKWLTTAERDALLSMQHSYDPVESHVPSSRAVLAVLQDARVWLLGLFLFCIMFEGYGYSFVAPTLLQLVTGRGVGYAGNVIAGLGLMGALGMLLNGWHSDRTGERFWHILAPTFVLCVSCVVAGLARNPLVVMAALGCSSFAFYGLQIPFLTLAPGFLRNKSAAAGIAAVNSIGLTGGFLGPIWMGRVVGRTGSYQWGLLTLALPVLVSCGLIAMFRWKAASRKSLAEFAEVEAASA